MIGIVKVLVEDPRINITERVQFFSFFKVFIIPINVFSFSFFQMYKKI